MGAKDRKANEYFADNRRFADMCNAVLFGGRTVILPEALEACLLYTSPSPRDS